MQSNNGEDENQRQDKDNNRVDLQSGRFVGVKSQHGAAGAASASGPCAAWPGIGKLLLLISGSTSTDRSSRAAGRSGRGRSADAGTAGRGGAIGG